MSLPALATKPLNLLITKLMQILGQRNYNLKKLFRNCLKIVPGFGQNTAQSSVLNG